MPGRALHGGLDDLLQFVQALLQQVVAHAEGADLGHKRGVFGADSGQLQRCLRLLVGGSEFGLQQFRDLGRADLFQLVDAAQHAGGVVQADAAVEAFGQFAVVDAQAEVRNGQGAEGLGNHQGDLHVIAERQLAVAHDVDVRLGEFAGAAFLRTFAAPDLLDLVAPEREREVAGVLHDVAGKGHRQVEVQREGVRIVLSGLGCIGVSLVILEAAEPVDLFIDLALAQQLADGFHGTGLDGREAVQLKNLAEGVQHMQLHQPLLGKPLGESGQGGGACHGGMFSS